MFGWAVTVMCFLGVAAQAPVPSCPSEIAIAAELDRLGTARAVAALGSPSVTVDGTTMWVVLRGLDGEVSGARQVNAPATCADRAAVAASIISAWVGTWSSGALSPSLTASAAPTGAGPITTSPRIPAPASVAPTDYPHPAGAALVAHADAPLPSTASPQHEPSSAQTSAPKTSGPGRSVRGSGELGGYVFGIHDLDQGTGGGGLLASYRSLGGWGINAQLDGTGERQSQVGAGVGAYHLYAFGLGPSLGRQSGRLYSDLAVVPQATLLTIQGRNLPTGHSVSRWGVSVGARVRLGLTLGALRPFVFAGVSCALRGERLTLDNVPDNTTLSRWNLSAGAGLAYVWEIGGRGVTK